MSAAHLLQFNGRAIGVRVTDESVREIDTAARHVESLSAAMRDVAAIAQDVSELAAEDPRARQRLHSLLVSIEVLASLCAAIGEAAAPWPVGDS